MVGLNVGVAVEAGALKLKTDDLSLEDRVGFLRGAIRSRPPFEKAEMTAEVMVFSRPTASVLFLNIGTATVLMWPGRLPRKLYPQPLGRQAAQTSNRPTATLPQRARLLIAERV